MKLVLILVLVAFVLVGAPVLWSQLGASTGSRSASARLRELRLRLLPSRAASVGLLQKRSLSRMSSHVTGGVDGASTIAPSTFSVAISPRDFDRVAASADRFCRELEQEFTRLATNSNWQLATSVSVGLVSDADVTHGSPRVHARFEQAISGEGPGQIGDEGHTKTVGQAQLELVGSREFWPVPMAGVKIGRSSTCDIQVDRPTVSRVHCELKILDGTWVVADVGSANGTFVNGEKITAGSPVEAEGEIRLGKSVLLRLVP